MKSVCHLIIIFLSIPFCYGQNTVCNQNLSLYTSPSSLLYINGSYHQDTLFGKNDSIIQNAGTIEITENWTNHASKDIMAPGGGKINFTGNKTHQITGPTKFETLVIDNQDHIDSAITLHDNIQISDTLKLISGNINLNNNAITVGTNKNNLGHLSSDSNWVYSGTLKRWYPASTIVDSSQEGYFPIGSSESASPLLISSPVEAPDTAGIISVRFDGTEGSSATGFFDSTDWVWVKSNKYWNIETTQLDGGKYNIGGSQPLQNVSDLNHLRMVLSDTITGNPGINSGTMTSPFVKRKSISFQNLSNRFHIGSISANTPLPVTFVELKIINHQLEWIVEGQINCSNYIIDGSKDGYFFDKIGNLSCSKSLNDQYIFPLPQLDYQYYRIIQQDYNGEITISPIVSPVENNLEKITFYIEGDFMNLEMNDTLKNTSIILTNSFGIQLYRNYFPILKDETLLKIPIQKNKPLLLRITSDTFSIKQKVIFQ